MTPRSTSRKDAITSMADFVKLNGLSGTSLRTLADAVGTSDRMLLYYFKDKSDIMDAVLQHLITELSDVLANIIPMGPRLPSDAIFMKVAEFTQSEDLKPYMLLRLEILAQAKDGTPLYSGTTKQIADTFITWFDDRLQIANMDARYAHAVMLLAMIDGLFQVSLSTDNATFIKARNAMATALRGVG